MRLRSQPLGNKNLIGARVEAARKSQGMKQKELLAQLQVRGVDLNASGLSKLEGQIRFVTDFELLALSDILNVSVSWLLTGEEKKCPAVPFTAGPWAPKQCPAGRQGLENPSALSQAEGFSYIPAGTLHSKKSDDHRGGLPQCCEMGS